MGQAHAPSGSHSQPALILTALFDAIGPLLCQQGIQFPERTPRPAGHQSRRPHHSSATSQHGSTWCRRLVRGSIPRPLPLPQMLHSIHLAKLERPHCRLVPPYCPHFQKSTPTTICDKPPTTCSTFSKAAKEPTRHLPSAPQQRTPSFKSRRFFAEQPSKQLPRP
jgi:hypothetical protein